MPRKTIIIFITVFVLVGAGLFAYNYHTKSKSSSSSVGSQTPGYNSFNPLGSSSSPNTTQNATNTTGNVVAPADNNASGATTPTKLYQITNFPVAGASYLDDTRPLPQAQAVNATPDTTTPTSKTKTSTKVTPPNFQIVPSLRYVERVTGHIDEMYLDTKAVGEISNSTIPSIYEAFFDSKAETVIYRYLESDDATIDTFMATLGGSKGEFLPQGITDISLSPDKTKFFYITQATDGVVGTIRSFGSTKPTIVFNSPFNEWLSQWAGSQKIYLTTKASALVTGDLFSLNVSNGSLTKIFGGVLGLTTLANGDGSLVLYSSATASGPKLGIYNIAKNTTSDTGEYGLPEKCVWSTDNINIYCAIPDNISGSQYPDVWYQGKVSFTDQFVKINSSTLNVTTIEDSVNGIPVDGTHLFLSSAEDQLFFINKKDSTLWGLSLN